MNIKKIMEYINNPNWSKNDYEFADWLINIKKETSTFKDKVTLDFIKQISKKYPKAGGLLYALQGTSLEYFNYKRKENI